MKNITNHKRMHLRYKSLAATSIICLCLWLVPSMPAVSGDVSNITGAFLDVGLGAAPMGMAGSNTVLVRDVHALLSNPAGLTSVNGQELAFSMTKQFSIIPYNVFLYGQKIEGVGGIGVGFLTSGDDALKENTVILSYARLIAKGIAGGLTFKYRQASYGNNDEGMWDYNGGNRQVTGDAKGFGMDIGFRGRLAKQMGFGILLKDVFSSVNYNASNEVGTAKGGSESIPTSLVLGVAYISQRYLTFEFNLRSGLHDDTSDRFYLGAERDLFNLIALRGGFSQNVNSANVNRNYTAGFGIGRAIKPMMMKIDLDFAYVINDFQNFYHIGLKLERNTK
ncbi:hypothetical protein JW960_19945 [candidate division KSB1 bacterium]|nr:hypothetical protein [candidate division KSB1 bacterium]